MLIVGPQQFAKFTENQCVLPLELIIGHGTAHANDEKQNNQPLGVNVDVGAGSWLSESLPRLRAIDALINTHLRGTRSPLHHCSLFQPATGFFTMPSTEIDDFLEEELINKRNIVSYHRISTIIR